jgi:predicted transposase/invertase (TIGR01784 family)
MLPDKYINPFTDFGFKKLFGEEPNKDLLMSFLNLFLPDYHQIEDLSYAKNEFGGLSEFDRKAIFDLYCVGKNGERFIVEIQKAKQNFFKDRSVFYSSFPIQEQAQRGDWNFQLNHVYLFAILDFTFTESGAEIVHTVKLKDQNCNTFYDKLTFVYIEMPKFNKTENELETMQDKWFYVFRNLQKLDGRPRKLQEKVFERLFKSAEIAKYSPAERQIYEDNLKYYRDFNNVIETAKGEGVEEGIEIGIEQGIEQEKLLRLKKVIESGKFSNAEIAGIFDVDVEFIQTLNN